MAWAHLGSGLGPCFLTDTELLPGWGSSQTLPAAWVATRISPLSSSALRGRTIPPPWRGVRRPPHTGQHAVKLWHAWWFSTSGHTQRSSVTESPVPTPGSPGASSAPAAWPFTLWYNLHGNREGMLTPKPSHGRTNMSVWVVITSYQEQASRVAFRLTLGDISGMSAPPMDGLLHKQNSRGILEHSRFQIFCCTVPRIYEYLGSWTLIFHPEILPV